MSTVHFGIDYDKRGMASCKKCKQKLLKGQLRISKMTPNPFSEHGGDMKQYFHSECIFESFQKARANTKTIQSSEDLEGWAEVTDKDKAEILKLIQELPSKHSGTSPGGTKISPVKDQSQPTKGLKQKKMDNFVGHEQAEEDISEHVPVPPSSRALVTASPPVDRSNQDNFWSEFCKLCRKIGDVSSYNAKTEAVRNFLQRGASGKGFKGNTTLVCKLLMPGAKGLQRVYNINSKQLIKLFSQIFGAVQERMMQDLDLTGDVSETVKRFFEESKRFPPAAKSTLTVQEVDAWLDEMCGYTTESDQLQLLKKIAKRCTPEDLLFIVRQLKKDLRINAGPKHVLDALAENAYTAFQASRNLESVVQQVTKGGAKDSGSRKGLSVGLNIGIPVQPMLAEPCKTVESAMKKCPNGMFAEVKYDGERVQVHKHGDKYQYFSRSLKPVGAYKVQYLKNDIVRAFGDADLILDAEILLVDTKTGKPLPFGTLGIHKKENFKDSSVCLFVFDCLYFGGESLIDRPVHERKKILRENMTVIPYKIEFSEYQLIKDKAQLAIEISRAIREGLEGLVLKDIEGFYEPGKRHWLKVKKDYLQEGQMADSADLIVLGAYYGTGNKGGMMSVFLMGCYDEQRKLFCTVTKCGNGHDDATLERINREMKNDVIKISKDFNKVPSWLTISRQLVPDFVVKDPKKAPVWEIAGAEFSKSEAHTADGISIRFPRVTKIRDDKDWMTATSLNELKDLYVTSKVPCDFLKDGGEDCTATESDVSPNKKTTKSVSKTEPVSGNSTPQKKTSPAKQKQQLATEKAPGSSRKRKSEDKQQPDESSGEHSGENELKEETNKEASLVEHSRPACKYGKDCYQHRKQHKAQFWHPVDIDDPESSQSSSKTETVKESSCFLHGLKFYVPEKLSNRKTLVRYIALFDGELTDEFHLDEATHAILDETSERSKNLPQKCEVVNPSWLLSCVKEKCIKSI